MTEDDPDMNRIPRDDVELRAHIGLMAYRLEQAEKRAAAMQADIFAQFARLEAEAARIEAESQAREARHQELERNRLRAGIGALGSVIMLLGGIIWGYRSVIFRGAD